MTNQLLYFSECRTEKISFENIQIAELLESYASGQTVKVSCASGHVGILKLECKNGLWNKVGERECRSKHTLVKSKYIYI